MSFLADGIGALVNHSGLDLNSPDPSQGGSDPAHLCLNGRNVRLRPARKKSTNPGVHQGKPYREKPRLFLKREDFEQEDDNAWFIEGDSIWRREGGEELRLSMGNGFLTFENDKIRIHLSPDLVADKVVLKEAFDGELSMREAAEMYVVLDGISASAAFLV